MLITDATNPSPALPNLTRALRSCDGGGISPADFASEIVLTPAWAVQRRMDPSSIVRAPTTHASFGVLENLRSMSANPVERQVPVIPQKSLERYYGSHTWPHKCLSCNDRCGTRGRVRGRRIVLPSCARRGPTLHDKTLKIVEERLQCFARFRAPARAQERL